MVFIDGIMSNYPELMGSAVEFGLMAGLIMTFGLYFSAWREGAILGGSGIRAKISFYCLFYLSVSAAVSIVAFILLLFGFDLWSWVKGLYNGFKAKAIYLMQFEWATVPILILAVVLYRLRCTHRYLYGQLEVLVGVAAIWGGLHVSGTTIERGILLPAMSESGTLLVKALTLSSGVYVVIRGLDNMAQSLPERHWRLWSTLFPGGRKLSKEEEWRALEPKVRAAVEVMSVPLQAKPVFHTSNPPEVAQMNNPFPAGYVVASEAIYGYGDTPKAARQNAERHLAAEGFVVLKRGETSTSGAERVVYADQLRTLPATKTLIEEAKKRSAGTRDERWLVVGGVACQRDEME